MESVRDEGERDRDLVADRAVWPFLVVVSTPSLQLFSRIRKRQEPVGIQAFCPESAFERFNVSIVCRFPRPGKVERDPALASPEVHVAGDELRPFGSRPPNRCTSREPVRASDQISATGVPSSPCLMMQFVSMMKLA